MNVARRASARSNRASSIAEYTKGAQTANAIATTRTTRLQRRNGPINFTSSLSVQAIDDAHEACTGCARGLASFVGATYAGAKDGAERIDRQTGDGVATSRRAER